MGAVVGKVGTKGRGKDMGQNEVEPRCSIDGRQEGEGERGNRP